MSTYLLLPHDDGRKGHPIFFERKLLPGSGGTHDGDGGPFVQYVTGWSEPPVFVVKAAPLSFDIGPVAADEHFVSERLLAVLQAHSMARHRSLPVRFQTRSGDVRGAHHALRVLDRLDAVDRERSDIVPHPQYDYLTLTRRLVVDPDRVGDLDLFRLDDPTFGQFLFGSERLKAAAVQAGVDLRWVPAEEASPP